MRKFLVADKPDGDVQVYILESSLAGKKASVSDISLTITLMINFYGIN